MVSDLKLRIKNYKSYLDSGWVNLDGKIILTGIDERGRSNGVGKTSILEVLDMFITSGYEEWTKADIVSVINNTCGKKEGLELSLSCNIDGKEFNASISGRDCLVFEGDSYLYNKFKQEFTGCIMNQGLVDNIADFEKRSELDNYIDRFYNVKEIITKLGDFKTEASTGFNSSLEQVKTEISRIESDIRIVDSQIFRSQGLLEQYSKFMSLDPKLLDIELEGLKEKVKAYKSSYTNIKTELNSKIKENESILNNNNDKVKELDNLKLSRDQWVRIEIQNNKSNYLNKLYGAVDSACDKKYILDSTKILDKDLDHDILSDIGYEVSLFHDEWETNTPKTGREVLSKINKLEDSAKTIIGTSTKKVQVKIIPEAEEMSNTSEYFIVYKNLDFKIDIKYHVPQFISEVVEGLSWDWSAPNTSYWDAKIQELETLDFDKIKSETVELKEELTKVLVEESEKVSLDSKIEDIETQLQGYRDWAETGSIIVCLEDKKRELEKALEVENSKKRLLEKRLSDLNNLIGSITKYSGEDLRKEFGVKLGRLASVLVEDIFGFKGEIALDSNGTKTSFKFNEGNGFLSFKRLSGGQLQKIKLAINLAMLLFFYKDRQYIFLDEVFQHLDPASKEDLINYITNKLNIKNVLLIQHEDLVFPGFKELKIIRDKDHNSHLG